MRKRLLLAEQDQEDDAGDDREEEAEHDRDELAGRVVAATRVHAVTDHRAGGGESHERAEVVGDLGGDVAVRTFDS